MIRDALELIQKTAREAAKSTTQAIPHESRRVLLLQPDGGHTFIDTPIHMVAGLDRIGSVYEWSNRWASEVNAAFFLSQEKLVLVKDVADRRERVYCNLELTDHAQRLHRVTSYSQESFLQLLRFDFAERVDKVLIDKIKGIKFKASTEGESQVGHQGANASIGRSVQIEALVGGSIPDTVIVRVKPYEALDFEEDVVCAVVINVEHRNFSLKPIGDEFEDCIRGALDTVAAMRIEGQPPLFFGSVND